jgi:tetratricopeptide (TPR) repeat protein
MRRLGLTIFMLVMALILPLPLRAQQKPFTQEQISNMVRDGFGDDSGAKLIEQRGIDFTPAEDFIQSLQAAGASAAFLQALRTVNSHEPASMKKPLDQIQIIALLAGGVPILRVAMLVKDRGIDFDVKDDYLQDVLRVGGDQEIIAALKNASVAKPAEAVDPAAAARQADTRQHIARGAVLAKRADYALAEQEYREALQLDPQSADLYVSLAYVLIPQQKWDDTQSAARAALRLDPKNDMAHNNLGVALGSKGDLDGAVSEFREAIRLNPNYDVAHDNLGVALGMKDDVDGAIAEYREAVRLNPKYEVGHYNLGVALERKGDWRAALEEYQTAYTLNPDNADYKQNYERLSKRTNKKR